MSEQEVKDSKRTKQLEAMDQRLRNDRFHRRRMLRATDLGVLGFLGVAWLFLQHPIWLPLGIFAIYKTIDVLRARRLKDRLRARRVAREQSGRKSASLT